MIIKKLFLQNYKTYYGQQELNLYIPKDVREEGKQNIILIGGLNGAGKTTILKAIHYALFGERAMSKDEHKRQFSNVLNNTYFDEGGRECSIILNLELDAGEEWDLVVKWTFNSNKILINENREITVRKPGMMGGKKANVENIAAYDRFIDRIIPYHAAPFFIFDGEEIKEIILRQNSHEMKEAIHKISGIDAYKTLAKDLESLKSSVAKELSKAKNQTIVSTHAKRVSELEAEIAVLEEKTTKLSQDRSKTRLLLDEAKKRRNDKLLLNSRSRETIVNKQGQISQKLELTFKKLNEIIENRAVEIILNNKIQLLQNTLRMEYDKRQRRLIHEARMTPYYTFFNQLIQQQITPPLSDEQLLQLRQAGEQLWKKENNIKESAMESTEEIHDLTPNEYTYLISIQRANHQIVTQLINEIETLQQELAATESELRNAPESVDLTAENEQIDLLTKNIGAIDLRWRSSSAKLNTLVEEKSQELRKMTHSAHKGMDGDRLEKRLNYITRLESGMRQFIQEMTRMKAEFIADEFARMLTVLYRKQDEFGRIEFDVTTYTIRLYNDRHQEISIQDRSAGEMQMIASALIWALTKASDLSLPMIIDTPLGRLDSQHRNHLIHHYYKNLSEQVIILSTDTEITEEYVTLMKQTSYKQFMLDYNQEKKYTIIRDGYFNFVKV